ncbi:secreted protein/lipoprotein [Streptomyces maremycinicus]|nr:secreted protein/lipoprotein [Streptomyces sp. B9173]
MEKLYADPTGKSVKLDQYAASAALKNAQSDAKRAHDSGNVLIGGVTITKSNVTQTEISAKVPHVLLSSCLDISKWKTVDVKTKKPANLPGNRLLKYLIVSAVEKYPQGWRVTRDEPQGKSC